MASKYIKAKAPPTRIIGIRVNHQRYERWKVIGRRIAALNANREDFNYAIGDGLDKMMKDVEAELTEAEAGNNNVNVNVNGADTRV